jgi:Phosphorylated adapter RNA export protein, RNA-binding domain
MATETSPGEHTTAPVVAAIAAQLGETEQLPLRQIARALATLGEERVRAFVAEALATEAQGGLMLPDGSRRRTLGGVFFHLLRKGVTPAERRAIFPPYPSSRSPAPAAAKGARFSWEDYAAALHELRRPGEATSVKITVIGRPVQTVERGPVVIVSLKSERVPSLPKGLPAPAQATAYALLIARKQWEKVAASLRQPDDLLIVEGYPTLDRRFEGITVLATRTTTKLLQQAERQRQQKQ